MLSPAELLLEKGQKDLAVGSLQLEDTELWGHSLAISPEADEDGHNDGGAFLPMVGFFNLKKSLNLLEYLKDDDGVVDADDDDGSDDDEALGDVGVVRGIDLVLDGDEQRELLKLMHARLLRPSPPREFSMVMEKHLGLSLKLLAPAVAKLLCASNPSFSSSLLLRSESINAVVF